MAANPVHGPAMPWTRASIPGSPWTKSELERGKLRQGVRDQTQKTKKKTVLDTLIRIQTSASPELDMSALDECRVGKVKYGVAKLFVGPGLCNSVNCFDIRQQVRAGQRAAF